MTTPYAIIMVLCLEVVVYLTPIEQYTKKISLKGGKPVSPLKGVKYRPSCELHFDERFVERKYKYIIDGKEVLLSRTRPILTADAFPSIFPNLPKYMTKKLPPKRSSKIRDGPPPPLKRKKKSFEWSSTTSSPDNFDSSNNDELTKVLDSVPLPSKWCKIKESFIMPNFCSAYGCSNASNKASSREKGISFHVFPLNDKDRLKLWILKLRRKNFVPSPNSRLCSEHFTDADFEYQPYTNRRGLKNTAVPTKFCFTPTEIPEKPRMPNFCSAHDCSNASNKESSKDKGVTFHHFPLNDKERLKLWLLKMRRKNFKPSPMSRLCSEHFTDADFEYPPFTDRKGLKDTAVPTKFCFTTAEAPEKPRTSYEFQSRIVQHDVCENDTSSENDASTQSNDICANHLSEIERLKTENSQLKTDLKMISEYLIQLLENQ